MTNRFILHGSNDFLWGVSNGELMRHGLVGFQEAANIANEFTVAKNSGNP